MKLKKAIKNIFAVAVGAGMLGATLFSASAADLSQYPSMFIKDGQFDGLLVIGKNANAVDTLAITNIALGLQTAAVTEKEVCMNSETTISEGKKIVGAGQDFDVWLSVGELIPIVDSLDLPSVLGDAEYEDNSGETKGSYEYSQTLHFPEQPLFTTGGAGSAYFKMTQDEDGAPNAGAYMEFTEDHKLYDYILEFDSPVEYDTTAVSEDFQSSVLEIQGQDYTITGVHSTEGVLDKITLMAGDTTYWMLEGQTITKNVGDAVHTIKMVDVTDDSTSCGFDIDGTSVWIDVDDTETYGGLSIGVVDAKVVHSDLQDSDICKVNFGATEIILEDGQEVKIDGSALEGSEVSLNATGNSAAGVWDGINITWTPEDDNLYISPTPESAPSEFVDPVFGKFKIVFAKEVRTNDVIMMTTSTTSGAMTFTSSDGKDVSIPIVAIDDNSTVTGLDSVAIGTDDDPGEMYYYFSAAHNYTTCEPASGDVRDCEGGKWIAETGHEVHILELEDIDVDDKKISFYDEVYGTDDNNNELADVTYATTNEVYVSGFGIIGVKVDATKITLSDIGSADSVETDGGATLTIVEGNHSVDTTNDLTFKWTEDTALFSGKLPPSVFPQVPGIQTATVLFPFSVNTDEELEIGTPTGSLLPLGCGTGSWNDYSVDNTDIQSTSTFRGTGIGHNTEDKNLAAMMHPDDIVMGDIYIAPVDGVVTTAEDGQICNTYEEVNKISSAVNKFDTDITNPTAQNLISVGGPCANSVSAALLGNPAVCYEGYEEGKAFLSLVESGSNVAMVLAGASGEDTLAASAALLEHKTFASKLSGKEMTIITTDPNNLVFEKGLKKAVAAAPVDVTSTVAESAPEPSVPVTPEPEKISCPGTTSETASYVTETSKLGIKRENTGEIKIATDGLKGTVTIPRSEPFEPEYGVDWYQFIVHILDGDANGPEVTSLTFKWVEGDKDKTMEFTVPEAGCYALKMSTSDLSIDGANIIIKSNDGVVTKDFSAE